MICTSYYAKAKNFDPGEYAMIVISRYPPKWWNRGQSMMELAPTGAMLKMSTERYLVEFYRILANLKAEAIRKRIEDLAHGKNAVLLCYEKPPDFCHRHLVADWLEKKLGIDVQEIGQNGRKFRYDAFGNLIDDQPKDEQLALM